MSAALDLIRKLHQSGVCLEARGDRLHVEAPRGSMTADLRALLVNRKMDLLQALEATGTHARLLAAVVTEYADPDLIHRLHEADVEACEGLPDSALRAYVRALEDEAERMAGRVPRNETAAIWCARCGSVWAPPEVALALPVVKGLPRVLGCPWCHVRKSGGYIPRPTPGAAPASATSPAGKS